jgi:hypothetical protein
VLSILNKEQRGYLTPDEFNKIATQVQLEIFEKFFEDYNQYTRMPKTDVEFASRMDHIYEEFQIFIESNDASAVAGNVYTQPVFDNSVSPIINPVHRLGSINYNIGIGSPEIELVNRREYTQQTLSPITKPSLNFPIGIYEADKITVYPESPNLPAKTDVTFNYIRKPKDVVWGYTIGTLGQYLFASPGQLSPPAIIPDTGSVNFEISDSQQTECILKILQYAGLVIRDQQVIQAAQQELMQDEANSKR